jgi:hypothetical protein
MCPLLYGGYGAGGSVNFDTDVLFWFLRGDRAMELLQGARSRGEIKEIHQFIQQSRIRLIPVNATAREAALPLATGNARHFKAIAGLELKVFRPEAE